MQGCLKNNTNPILKMEIIFSKSLARPPRWVRFALPNENWALWRVWAMLINSCVIASPADILAGLQAKGSNSPRTPKLPLASSGDASSPKGGSVALTFLRRGVAATRRPTSEFGFKAPYSDLQNKIPRPVGCGICPENQPLNR
jgi:hypothetical protein